MIQCILNCFKLNFKTDIKEYKLNKPVTYECLICLDELKYNDGDPRNNMVEPKLILDSYRNFGKLKPVACATK